jgi:hypothetical protein
MLSPFDLKSGPHEAHIEIQISAYWELIRNGIEEGLDFASDTHTFLHNGEVLPSVTQVLKANRMTPDGYAFIDPYYLTRGTYIHSATEFYDKGTLDEDSLDEAIRPYLEAYKRFRSDFNGQIVGIEKRLWHPKLKYAGIVDRIIDGNTCYALHLKPGNKVPYKLEPIENVRSAFNVFLSALNVYTWRANNFKEV